MVSICNLYSMFTVLKEVANVSYPDTKYDLFWDDQNRPARLDDLILIAETIKVSKDDIEIYPEAALSRGFWIYCSGELIQDVISLAIEQKPNANGEELLMCLEHYIEFDDYLDL